MSALQNTLSLINIYDLSTTFRGGPGDHHANDSRDKAIQQLPRQTAENFTGFFVSGMPVASQIYAGYQVGAAAYQLAQLATANWLTSAPREENVKRMAQVVEHLTAAGAVLTPGVGQTYFASRMGVQGALGANAYIERHQAYVQSFN
ncbi:MAG: hypothetical protein AAF654_08815 [Myxococcota bacterium]